jgi:hypothetical protein
MLSDLRLYAVVYEQYFDHIGRYMVVNLRIPIIKANNIFIMFQKQDKWIFILKKRN